MNKREFLKVAGLGGLAMSGSAGLVSCSKEPAGASTNFPETLELAKKQHKQSFNMTGYAAPAIDTVKIAYLGLGNRGFGALKRMVNIAAPPDSMGSLKIPALFPQIILLTMTGDDPS